MIKLHAVYAATVMLLAATASPSLAREVERRIDHNRHPVTPVVAEKPTPVKPKPVVVTPKPAPKKP